MHQKLMDSASTVASPSDDPTPRSERYFWQRIDRTLGARGPPGSGQTRRSLQAGVNGNLGAGILLFRTIEHYIQVGLN